VPVKSSSECIARPGAPLQSRSGDAALVVSKQGVLALTSLANDETTVLWSSSTAGSQNVVTEAAAVADARAGLFMQVRINLVVSAVSSMRLLYLQLWIQRDCIAYCTATR
jgi:hypothetical protein